MRKLGLWKSSFKKKKKQRKKNQYSNYILNVELVDEQISIKNDVRYRMSVVMF